MKTTLIIVLVLLAGIGFSAGNASALSLVAYEYNNASINPLISDNGGVVKALEKFDSDATGWYASQSITVDDTGRNSFGTFTTREKKDSGAITLNDRAAKFPTLQKNKNSTFQKNYGRDDLTGGKYLDSGTSAEMKLQLPTQVQNIYFCLIDPSDAGAITAVYANDLSNTLFSNLPDALKWFIGISLDANEGNRNAITWITGSVNDGSGVTVLSTVFPIPEPATMMLFGIGIASFAGFKSRIKKK